MSSLYLTEDMSLVEQITTMRQIKAGCEENGIEMNSFFVRMLEMAEERYASGGDETLTEFQYRAAEYQRDVMRMKIREREREESSKEYKLLDNGC